jgi:hypothetical protein
MVPAVQKIQKTGLTRLQKSQVAQALDPDAYHLQWRLKAVQEDLWALRVIAARNRHRWPKMEEQLHQASLTVLSHITSAEVACEQASADFQLKKPNP